MTVPNVRDVDGLLVVDWPEPCPEAFTITADAFAALIEHANRHCRHIVTNDDGTSHCALAARTGTP